MTESEKTLEERLRVAVQPEYRKRLLDKGLARNLIWEAGVLPEGSPSFPHALTDDLLDYGYSVLAIALQLRKTNSSHSMLERAFVVSGEAFESAVHRGKANISEGFHRVSAAVAFHLARYSARAFSILPDNTEMQNWSPMEKTLVCLLRRNFNGLHSEYSGWLLSEENQDEKIALRLKQDDDFETNDAAHVILTSSFMKGIALFGYAIDTGNEDSADRAKRKLYHTAESALKLNLVNHWWTVSLAAHLIDELWEMSFHKSLPLLPEGPDFGASHYQWNELRSDYIYRLRASSRAAIELWPSQLTAAKRAIDPLDDLVVALPTSAGKTRIAELCILRCLANELRVIYITPLRALSAQIERDLAEVFVPLGHQVTALYGSAGIQNGDSNTLKKGTIVVATPEKLDFALRNDSSIIDDVGLIVFDEGHMLGKGEREVRYETLVQRILRREDASNRRVVCLSALFPNPEDMEDLVAWIRQDEEGDPVHSMWRPTRQRFGIIEQNSYGGGRLEISLGEEQPFVPRFVEQVEAPTSQRRKIPFPRDKNELTIASAWRFIDQGKKVLVYCSMKKSVETLGRLILDLLNRGFIEPLVTDSEPLKNARSVGVEWLGENHPAVKCLEFGVVLHHGGLPRQFLSEVEDLLKLGICPLTVASPTLAQGLNLSASVLLVPSIWRGGEKIPVAEFANVAGRAGRAFVDLEGLILHVVWGEKQKATRNWKKLVEEAKAPLLKSGVLHLAIDILVRIAHVKGVEPMEVMEYVTGNSLAWGYSAIEGETKPPKIEDWERDIASLDAALLGMLDVDCEVDEIPDTIKVGLEGSLFSRQAENLKEGALDVVLDFLAARAEEIWANTDGFQRRGFYFAGIGMKAGLLVSSELETLLGCLYYAEQAIEDKDHGKAISLIVKFAEIVFGFAPFLPYKGLPQNWSKGLEMWLSGEPSADVIAECGKEGVEFLQDGIAYRLPWAMEAVRVYCIAVERIEEDWLSGQCAIAVETGSLHKSVMTLTRGGLSSREAANSACRATGADFEEFDGMMKWLRSEGVAQKSSHSSWPTPNSRYSWLKFFERDQRPIVKQWEKESASVDLLWLDEAVKEGEPVVLEKSNLCKLGFQILTPDYKIIGETKYEFNTKGITKVKVAEGRKGLVMEYFGANLEI